MPTIPTIPMIILSTKETAVPLPICPLQNTIRAENRNRNCITISFGKNFRLYLRPKVNIHAVIVKSAGSFTLSLPISVTLHSIHYSAECLFFLLTTVVPIIAPPPRSSNAIHNMMLLLSPVCGDLSGAAELPSSGLPGVVSLPL